MEAVAGGENSDRGHPRDAFPAQPAKIGVGANLVPEVAPMAMETTDSLGERNGNKLGIASLDLIAWQVGKEGMTRRVKILSDDPLRRWVCTNAGTTMHKESQGVR